MSSPVLSSVTGARGPLCRYHWPHESPRFLAVLSHGGGEHLGRYQEVADTLHALGADVSGADHLGHGRSGGERMHIEDFEVLVDDLDRVVQLATAGKADLPIVLIGHSMGGMIATRYAQRHPERLAALVLSGPLLGPWPIAPMLLAMDPMPDFPIDPQTLSRDPRVQQAYASDPLIWHGGLPRASLEAVTRMLATIDAGPGLGSLPTLWLHGADDQLVPPEVTRQGLQRVAGNRFEQRLFPGARHEIFLETNRDEVLATMTGFVARELALH
jgi:alpha-beta hydrolase superfamily lysophospholipase